MMENLREKVSELSAQNLYACYQCGKCSGGCPSVWQMDVLPNEVIRLLQIGQGDDALSSETIWICASCFTCSVRCPRGIDLARIMEALRQIRLRRNIDRVEIKRISPEQLAKLPQIALVGNFRKGTG